MRQIAYAAALSQLLALTGCIDYNEQVILDENGGGTVSLSYKLTSDFLQGFGSPESDILKTENENFRNSFESEGIGITHSLVTDNEESREYSMDLTFNNDTALNSTEFYKSFSTFEIKSGKTLEYTRIISPREKSGNDAEDETEEKLAAMFQDNRFIFSVRMPAPVIASNGTINEDGYTVEWSYSFGEILILDKSKKMTAKCRISE